MLETIAIVLIVLWLLGLVSSYTMGGFVHILAAEETASGMDWYQGTADAVRKQLIEIEQSGAMGDLLQNYLDKHESTNLTARALTEKGLSFVAAPKLHHR